MSNGEKIRQDIKNEIKKYAKTYAVAYCKEAAKELTETAQYAIDEFYRAYDPKYYDRTYDLMKNSVSSYYHDNGKRVYGGTKISAENMKPYQRGTASETDPFEVVEFATHGWHGHPIRDIYTSPTPQEIVEDKINDVSFHDDLMKKANKEAQSKSYSYLNVLLGF